MAIQPAGRKPKVHGAPPQRGTLGNAAAIGFAIALGLLKGLGVSYTKVIQAGNEAQKALGALIDDMNELAKYERGSGYDEEFIAALKHMIEDLKKLLGLLGDDKEWNKKFPEGGEKLQKELKEFLENLIHRTADAFAGTPSKGNDEIKDWLDGKKDFD